MRNKLKTYFPSIRTREEVQDIIQSRKSLKMMFESWDTDRQTEFLDFCTGVRGIKILYDFMFKEIFNPETVPERLESLLSCLLDQKVHIMGLLPNDNTRISDETALLVTDIVVELQDGSICNVEIQKIGYAFPGQRSACYSSDLLLRQYKRVRDKKKKQFNYRDIGQVYTIVFFEQSPAEFHEFPKEYIHRFEQTSNTGMKMELLQKYLFISLDNFQKISQNMSKRNELEHWLTFLSTDDPGAIVDLIENRPEFKPLYRHIYDMCRNVENVMGLFSEELRELDRNTVQYMIDEQQEKIDIQREMISAQKKEIAAQQEKIVAQKEEIVAQKEEIVAQKEEIVAQQAQLEEQKRRIAELEELLRG